MQNHKRNKFVPLTVEAEDNQTVYALAKIKAIENELDAVTAHCDRMRSALQAIDDLSYSRGVTMEKPHWSLRVPGQSDAIQVVKEVLDSTPKQSLAAIKVKTLREVAGKQVYAEPHPVNGYVSRWLLTEADRIEREEV